MTLFAGRTFGPCRYAITLWQPMAHAVIHLGKTTENRPNIYPWTHAAGRTVAIHAGLKWSDEHAHIIEELTGRRFTPDDIAFGALIGTVDVDEIHWADGECCDPWGFDRGAHITIQRPRACEPIPLRGWQGLWNLPTDIARQLEAVTTR